MSDRDTTKSEKIQWLHQITLSYIRSWSSHKAGLILFVIHTTGFLFKPSHWLDWKLTTCFLDMQIKTNSLNYLKLIQRRSTGSKLKVSGLLIPESIQIFHLLLAYCEICNKSFTTMRSYFPLYKPDVIVSSI